LPETFGFLSAQFRRLDRCGGSYLALTWWHYMRKNFPAERRPGSLAEARV
jgi:hypothetical protein